MKQLLFLLLFPCLALAQYQNNAGQKISLGEQTSADGLVYRGVENDTALITPLSDTSAYIILDTVNNKFYNYKRNTNVWTQAGGSDTTSIAYVNTYGNQTVNGDKTFSSEVTGARFNPTSSTTTGTGMYLDNTNSLGFSTNSLRRMTINSSGNVGIGVTSAGYKFHVLATSGASMFLQNTVTFPKVYIGEGDGVNEYGAIGWNSTDNFTFIESQGSRPLVLISGNEGSGDVLIGTTTDNGAYPLQVNGQIFATNATIATSDEKFKENITPLNKGLEIVNKLKPVTFNFISDTENNFSEYEEVGFIAQDVDRALSTETFAKSIVKSTDDSEPTSTMGLATQNLIPILVKAIQEQQALIKALEQRILTLENK
jgi:trimeric autotransporter adhesin